MTAYDTSMLLGVPDMCIIVIYKFFLLETLELRFAKAVKNPAKIEENLDVLEENLEEF